MKNLVKLQLRNIFKSKFFYVCLGLTILLYPIFSLISGIVRPENGIPTIMSQIITLFSSSPDIVELIFIVLICCLDFSDGTTKNIIARGYTRKQLLFSKYITTLIGLFVINLVVIAITFAVGIKSGLGFESNMTLLLINYIVAIIAETIMYATLSILLEKTSTSIATCLIVPTIIPLILSLIDKNGSAGVAKYWISSISNDFIDNPILANLYEPLLVYIAYIVVFVVIGISFVKTKEIK